MCRQPGLLVTAPSGACAVLAGPWSCLLRDPRRGIGSLQSGPGFGPAYGGVCNDRERNRSTRRYGKDVPLTAGFTNRNRTGHAQIAMSGFMPAETYGAAQSCKTLCVHHGGTSVHATRIGMIKGQQKACKGLCMTGQGWGAMEDGCVRRPAGVKSTLEKSEPAFRCFMDGLAVVVFPLNAGTCVGAQKTQGNSVDMETATTVMIDLFQTEADFARV